MLSYKILLLLVCFFFKSCTSESVPEQGVSDAQPRILVFYKTSGYYHQSIPAGIAALRKLGKENNIGVDATNQSETFTGEGLKEYRAVVFLNTTQDVLNREQQAAFEQYIRSGRGFVGIHAATDTEYEWPWYNQLVGAYFSSHPQIQKARVTVTDTVHIATSFLPRQWERTDEWYNFKSINPSIKVLATLDESSYTGGTNGDHHPIAWYHEFDGGRAFYTAGGHTAESYSEPLFLKHIWSGIRYAMGE